MIEGYQGSDILGGHHFGFGSRYFTAVQAETISPAVINEEILMAGWSNGCPVIQEQIDSAEDPSELPDLLDKLWSYNFEFRNILTIVQNINRPLYSQLIQPQPRRLPEEPVGKHERQNVPISHRRQMAPMSTIGGFASPRLVLNYLDQFGAEHIMNASRIVAEAAQISDQSLSFLANLAQILFINGLDPRAILRRVFSADLLREETCVEDYLRLANLLDGQKPNDLVQILAGLSSQERSIFRIAPIP